jgi:hypothetical protein
VGIGIYQFKTKMIEVNKFTVTIDSMTYYTKLSNWDFAKYYHVDEQVTPTATTKPNTDYLVTIAFPSFKYQNTVSWTQSEIASNTEKTLSNVIPYTEYATLTQQPNYISRLFILKPQHNILLIVPGILILVLGFVIFVQAKNDIQYHGNLCSQPTPEQTARLNEAIQNKKVSDALETALRKIDTIHNWYADEDGATRELVASLITMGYIVKYHYNLGEKTTADAFFENSVVEAKLDPDQNEVNRLEGQISRYLKFQYTVHIVLYGQVASKLLSQIKEKVAKNPDRVFLTYLPDAKRVRKSNSA